MVLIKRREKLESNIKELTSESKKLEKEISALKTEKKRILCGRFGELLEKNAVSIQDVDLEEIVKVISANKDVYKAKIIKAASAYDETETADKTADNITYEDAVVVPYSCCFLLFFLNVITMSVSV
jgi:predicted nuclease with TOPRIM domain